jgi:putative membrane protein
MGMIQRKRRTISAALCFIGALIGLASACGDDDTSTSVSAANGGSGGGSVVVSTAGSTSSADAGLPAGDAGPASALDDGQILYAADTLNAGEVEQARAALPKLTNGGVRDFAQQMIDEHGAARDRLLQLAEDQTIDPAQSDVAEELRSKSQSNVESLLGAARSTSDALYIELQVSAHVDALELLDQLSSAADAEPLRQELIAQRGSVQTHLDRARALNDAVP